MQRVRFEWDPKKARSNRNKHGVSFEDATELFTGAADYLELYDAEHSDDEDRFIAVGPIQAGVVVVVYTERQDDVIRIVSARKATMNEITLLRQYLEGKHDG